MPHHKTLLEQIQNRAQTLAQQKNFSLAVFDLDSTLFDVGPRLEKILSDFAEVSEHQKLFPEQVKHFKNLRIERRDWGVRDTLIRAGLDGHHPKFHDALKAFWRKHFFSNEYLQYDVPYAGAIEYVQSLARAGSDIIYLTGRDVERMGEGSKAVLKKWNLPLDEKAHLVLKPHRSMDDAQFKKDWFQALPHGKYSKIWFFENEPVNIRLIQESDLNIEMIFFDSTHSGLAQVPENIPAIMHFLLEEYMEKK